MKTHVLSSSIKGVTSKFVPKRDGPYLIHKKVSPTTYLLAYPETPDKPIGKYHISDLKRYHAREDACSNVPEPVIPKRRRGRGALVLSHEAPARVGRLLMTALTDAMMTSATDGLKFFPRCWGSSSRVSGARRWRASRTTHVAGGGGGLFGQINGRSLSKYDPILFRQQSSLEIYEIDAN
ncbi:hypothetical protein EVAR_11743_1 [Eumeta japonica]|uniref:Uncharacterized protein n=1 Tax=Eumeta variegata TaxID=151549 RepID=A0A4C1UR13_EUMVA|nr:hypothetical protein EVAR_11743_1 [Eumeta japonica]